MKSKILFPVLGIFICCFSTSFAQNTTTTHKVGTALTVVFPGVPEPAPVVQGNVGLYLSTEGVTYVVNYNQTDALKGVNTKSEFEEALEGAVKGYVKADKLQGFQQLIRDTVIGGSKGQLVQLFDRSENGIENEIKAFLTIQDGHFYAVQAIVKHSMNPSIDDINKFFKDVRFSGKNYDTTSSAFTIGKSGRSIIVTVISALAIAFVVGLIKRRRDKNKMAGGSL